MKNYTYQNNLISKKQLRKLLAWSFTSYDSVQACVLADELKYLGFRYASQAGISISIEDLKIPFVKNLMLEKAHKEIINTEKVYLKGKITEVERFQKIIDIWDLTSESLKKQVVHYFKNYDPLNSVYIMAFSGARGNLSQVRQLVGMRGLMSDPSGEIMKLPIKKNFREGLTITDYLMSGYGARKGIVDTALKTANSGYLTRRLIDVAQDILIREKDCLTTHTFLLPIINNNNNDQKKSNLVYDKILGRVLNKPIFDPQTNKLIVNANTQITPNLIEKLKEKHIRNLYIRSPLTCNLYRAICQKCYGWDLSNENLVDIGEAIGILAGQSIGEPGTQLTMRTFHTGGIFTSEVRQQILNPINGIVKFYKMLKTVILRTNRGEDVLVSKSSGSLIIIPEDSKKEFVKIDILKNTILFPKNNQYVLKDTVLGELINSNKQIKTEIKPILSGTCGEIFMPRLKKKINALNNNKLIWILAGQLYSSPNHSFINFYSDHKLNEYSYIFRTKILNHHSGFVGSVKNRKSLHQQIIKINNIGYSLLSTKLKKLSKNIRYNNFLLTFENLKYLIHVKTKSSKLYLQLIKNERFGTLITNSFRTLTGGILYYNFQNLLKSNKLNYSTSYYSRINKEKQYNPIISHRTIFWLEEENHIVDCEQNILFVEHGDFISEGFEILPGLFSKTSGIVFLQQRNNLVQTISIKSGLVYEGQRFRNMAQRIYFPGEIIFSNIMIKKVSICEHIINGKITEQLLIRPIDIYEFSYRNPNSFKSNFKFQSKAFYNYKSNQMLKGIKNLNLITTTLIFKAKQFSNKNINIGLINHNKTNSVDFQISEKLLFKNYVSPDLRYKNIHSCLLIQLNQFLDSYTTLCYLEVMNLNSLEIVKIKIKNQEIKQILLISNKNCLTLEKRRFPNKNLNDFITNSSNVYETGKIIIENDQFLTLQKGKPYFFPNCKKNDSMHKTNLEYKIISPNRIFSSLNINRSISLNYYNAMNRSVNRGAYSSFKGERSKQAKIKADFSKVFLKRNGKFYSSLIPQFLKNFSINDNSSKLTLEPPARSNNFCNFYDKFFFPLTEQDEEDDDSPKIGTLGRTLLIKNSNLLKSNYTKLEDSSYQLTLMSFIENPFLKTTKSISLSSITENYFEQDVNSVFCNDNEFVATGETLGFLNLEKEITGDIVQGLPRIEEILEARKKNLAIKRIPMSQKKGLLVQKTTLDPNFEFRKVGTTIKENEKINPHKLLKVYFNYYGLTKSFICDRTKEVQQSRLVNNYEGSYKSFKKVQAFILSSVQSVYKSQGVSINDKHLEVIIQQMTTKVLVTYEGSTPLLRREVIDLYHINSMNQIISNKGRQVAYYVPLLLGITKAALNNPSFISAASFQETTRVLSKAAIEGRIDWLRGLKENIIIGHLIPAGTGSPNYRNSFKKTLVSFNISKKPRESLTQL